MTSSMTSHRIRLDGVELNAMVTGSGPWVTLSHSLAASHAMWAPQIEALSSRFTVLAYDTRGHGESSVPAGPYTMEQLADDAHAMLRHLGVERTHWVGLSLGGMIGQMLALRHPEVLDRVVIANSSAQVPAAGHAMWAERAEVARGQGMGALMEGTLSRWFTPDFAGRAPATRQQIAAQILATPTEGYAGCCAAISKLNTLEKLHTLKLPALVIGSEQDQSTPVSMARDIASAWPGAELAILPDAAHLSNVEQPEAFNRELLRFLG